MDDLERRVVILSLGPGRATTRTCGLRGPKNRQVEEDVPGLFGLEREPVSPELQLFLERMLYDGYLLSVETPRVSGGTSAKRAWLSSRPTGVSNRYAPKRKEPKGSGT